MTMNAIIAVNPQQMQEAQVTTMGWIGHKLAAARRDLELASETVASLKKAGLRARPAEALAVKARRRIQFYEKVDAALRAGYVIIPPFNIQLFAVRTDRAPQRDHSQRHWAKDQEGRTLPLGEGRYVNPEVSRIASHTETRIEADKPREVTIYRNSNWQDAIDLPIRAMKPQIIEEVGKALELRIFDALGIAPAYRAADPIIAGQIRRPDGKGVLTFFVAWWLDESDL